MKTKESIYETYSRTVCSNCKNKEQCNEELRIKLNNTIKCERYEKENETEGFKDKIKISIKARKNKPIMKGIEK